MAAMLGGSEISKDLFDAMRLVGGRNQSLIPFNLLQLLAVTILFMFSGITGCQIRRMTMQYYHDMKNAESYAAMCAGHDAAAQLGILYNVLPDGATVLELGSGSGNDLELLTSHYQVTGSDYSPAFVEILRKRFPEHPVLMLDALTIETDKQFDAIYSNKVLHHLSDEDLELSLCRQADLLPPNGVVLHLIWRRLTVPGEDLGLIFEARETAQMKDLIRDSFELVETVLFDEFEEGDSIALLARKKKVSTQGVFVSTEQQSD